MPTGKPRTKADRPRSPSARRLRGVVLLTVLLFVFLTALAASSMVQMVQTQTHREREEELLFVGDQYRRAIAAYYNTIPVGTVRSLPASLDALLSDQRFATPVQHLRRLYADPLTGRPEWGLVQEGGGIVGVYSLSELSPMKRQGFAPVYRHFEGKDSYADWKFIHKRN